MNPLKSLTLAGIFLLPSIIFSQSTEIVFLSGTDAAHTVNWDFYCTEGRNSGEWTKIPVPSNWELEGFGTYNYGHDWKNKNKTLGKEHGLYKHEFEVPREWKGKSINIVFDGSMTDTKVKINGKLAGEIHQGAFYRFKYDITNLLNYGKKNLLEIDVAKHSGNESVNKAERQADFWIFGGIFRPVFLEILPPLHITRTAIDAKYGGTFRTLVEINKDCRDCAMSIELFDMAGKKVGKTIPGEILKGSSEKWLEGTFEGVRSWNPEKPVLYDMKLTLLRKNEPLHQVVERIGFRSVELREHDGIYINNEKVVFKGVNRHSFWPETGRCLSEENHLTDISLIKEMNMNAVRMSHYLPDKRFLELCDSIGLFVLNEITGWQDGYDTIVGPIVIKEAVLRDENHPSVVIWDHGNEGGWNFENEKWLTYWDIQDRPVICPWLLHNGIDTRHYPDYSYAIGRYNRGNVPFMPTELLHGLYDGGHGAGLDEFWTNYESSPLHAGGFLWALTDEAVLRTDMEGVVFDSDGNHGPDGIVGPHREKEGSFYTIKEIWSPVQIKPVTINRQWNGRLFLENKFIFTNLNECTFSWRTLRSNIGDKNPEPVCSGDIHPPDAAPGETSSVEIELNDALENADIFEFTAVDHKGMVLYSSSWPIIQSSEKAKEWLGAIPESDQKIKVEEIGNLVSVEAGEMNFSFSMDSGELEQIKNNRGKLSLSGGRPVGIQSSVKSANWSINPDGLFILRVNYDKYPDQVSWVVNKNGLLYFEAGEIKQRLNPVDFIGITFSFPEEKCEGITWMGQGPYRIWKNRIKGNPMGTWHKDYNNTITGESFHELIYPEFKGYHGKLYWAKIETTESDFTIVTETSNLFFQLFSPGKPTYVAGGTHPPFPEGDLSFLYEIPSIGTKFKGVESLGPGARKGSYRGHHDDQNEAIRLWFDFRTQNLP